MVVDESPMKMLRYQRRNLLLADLIDRKSVSVADTCIPDLSIDAIVVLLVD